MPLKGQRIGCLGGGAMGEALVAGMLREGLVDASEIYVSDIEHRRLEYLNKKWGVNTASDNIAVVKAADIIILAVKPQVIIPLLKEIVPAVRKEHTFISIAAGVAIEQIQSCFAGRIPVVRAIPNTPCLVGEGATALSAGKYAGEENMRKAMAVFAAAGKAVVVPEALLDSVTGLSGSGPAYMYVIMEGFIDGAVRLGLPRDTARVLIAQTMLGAAKMVLETGEHPGKLKDMVTTPGGTTMAGLFALEEGGVRALMMKAVANATQRAREMSDIK
ncbi:pyrroline-5-carboxylate reductase [Pelotomaculum terephthalicicum JT]|uniref:pyrroline-5-carboxylate reductase n=1 Tax=Pelotomaculum TaxID=191373 RepID=UPI0009D3E264|nr:MULTISPECIES: pyrroline-5-carboxylate reductase [Pelotomaculum]MCG9969547.1 pyrroline-5-carboxylate reductase [Pelotomaculum terephthalicicum JT]OPX86132.1 MAG: Pyrroline-5-carboxylate reductase [Pelotomaculum sp. PtaB.Bin117]OPY59537.1 MAG: Pyrroline-5-carboxylate reductase [Pelotomaculum sp. PtaU1.Bin035]